MKTLQYRYVDRSGWDRGPWDLEPDKVQWQDQGSGLPCLAVRNPRFGNWCGYVGVSEAHPYFGVGFGEIEGLLCHGGLTYSNLCAPLAFEHGICHLPEPGEQEPVWWLGFDCGHWADISPGMKSTLKKIGCEDFRGDLYRDLAYVKAQCRALARQLAALKSPRI